MKVINKYKYQIIIFLVTVILLLDLFINKRYQGHDTIFHVSNIICLSKSISLKHIFGININFFKFNNLGYGTYLFYPKMPHLLCAYLYLITKDTYLSMKIIYFIVTLLSGIFTFELANKIFKNKKLSLLSSIIYLSAPYHVMEIYIRDAFCENFIFLVFPMILLGILYLKEKNYKKFYIYFILGYVIGMNSHLVSMFFLTIFIFIYLLINYKTYLKKDKIISLIKSTIIVTLICLPFLTTMLEHKSLNLYRVFESGIFYTRLSTVSTVINLKDYIKNTPYSDNIRVYFNYATIALFALSTIYLLINIIKPKKKSPNKELINYLFIYNSLLVTLMSSKEIWNKIPEIFMMIQFVWRLMVPLTLLVSLYSVTIFIDLKKSKKKIFNITRNIIYIILIVLIVKEGLNNVEYYSEKEYPEGSTILNMISLGYQKEYLPYSENFKDSVVNYMTRNNDVIAKNTDENVKIKIVDDNNTTLKFEVKNITQETTIELPRVYYLGYVLRDSNNNKYELSNDNGLIVTKITKEGTYTLKYEKTFLEKLSKILSLVGVILFIIIIRRNSNGKEKNSCINTLLQRRNNHI